MSEEKNGVQNGTPNGDMPPQESSQKEPLTDGAAGGSETKAEVVPSETKVDLGNESSDNDEYRGLTKEELQKYSQEPFWKRLRIFLMVLFWVGWLAMLVLAILIIVQAPQCEPPPSLRWLQESPVLQANVFDHSIANLVSFMGSLGFTSFYLPSLISDMDYKILDTITLQYNSELIRNVTQSLADAKFGTVTDYVPNPVHSNHPWTKPAYANKSLLNNLYLNYDSEYLQPELQDVFEFWKKEFNVGGFLVPNSEAQANPMVINMTHPMNDAMEASEIVVDATAFDITNVIENLDEPGAFKEFVMNHYEEWYYYRFNPIGEADRPNTQGRVNCVTLSLMLLPDTPVLQVTGNNLTEIQGTIGNLIQSCVDFREKDAIKFGETQFANTTSNVVAFTRTMKGTPGYAVAINLGGMRGNNTEMVDFTKLKYVPDSGTLAYSITEGPAVLSTKVDLSAVPVGTNEGKVIQFVAQY